MFLEKRSFLNIIKPGLFILTCLIYIIGIASYSGRSVWIDEISSLINYPISDLKGMFGPLQYAQQAAPALFNLLSTIFNPLPIPTIRILFAVIISGIFVFSTIKAFDFKFQPSLAATAALASFPLFFNMATELKFYGLEIAGSAMVVAWVMRYDANRKFGLIDLGILAAATLLGISTLVLSFVAILAVYIDRLPKLKWPQGREFLVAFALVVFALGYYVQLQVAVKYQIESFPDSYDAAGFHAVAKLIMTFLRTYGIMGCVAIMLIYTTLIMTVRRSEVTRRFLIFSLGVVFAFALLAFLGKYPAVSGRHITWSAGIFAIGAGLAMDNILRLREYSKFWVLGWALAASFTAMMANVLPQLISGPANHTDNAKLVAWLEETPSSDIVMYYGAPRLIALFEERGADIGKHTYFGAVDLTSGTVDPAFFSDEYLSQDYDLISKDIINQINDPVGWGQMAVVFRILENFRGYAEFALDSASERQSFFVIATHVDWENEHPRYTALVDVLSERQCETSMEMGGSRVFVMKVSCL